MGDTGLGWAAALAGATVFCLVYGLLGRPARRTAERLERFRAPPGHPPRRVAGGPAPGGPAGAVADRDLPLRSDPLPRVPRKAAAAVGRWLGPGPVPARAGAPAGELGRLLHRAGWAVTPEEFRGAQALLAAALAAAGLAWGAGAAWAAQAALLPAGLAVAGWLAPAALAGRAAEARRERLARAVPEAVDLLWLASRGGLTLLQALEVVGQLSRGALRDEIARAAREARMGGSVPDALRGLAARLDVPAVSRLAAGLIRGAELGVPLGETLWQQARAARRDLRQAAETRLASMPTRLAIVGMVCFLPLVFVLILLPQVLGFFGSGW